jgi:hypothetical protein
MLLRLDSRCSRCSQRGRLRVEEAASVSKPAVPLHQLSAHVALHCESMRRSLANICYSCLFVLVRARLCALLSEALQLFVDPLQMSQRLLY